MALEIEEMYENAALGRNKGNIAKMTELLLWLPEHFHVPLLTFFTKVLSLVGKPIMPTQSISMAEQYNTAINKLKNIDIRNPEHLKRVLVVFGLVHKVLSNL